MEKILKIYRNMSKRMDIKSFSFWEIHRISNRTWSIFRAVLLIALGFVLLYPLIYMSSLALRPAQQLNDPSVVWVPRNIIFDNIKAAFEAMSYPSTLMTSVKLNIVTALIQVISCAFVAYGLARFKFKLKGLIVALVIFTIIVPPQTYLIPLYLEYRFFDFFGVGSLAGLFTGQKVSANLLNTVWTYYLPAVFASGLRSGLFIFIYMQFFSGLPKDLEDAAYIDGAGSIQTFLKIIIPLSTSVILIIVLLSMVWYWNDTMYISMFYSKDKTVSYALDYLAAELDSVFQDDYGNMSLRTVRMQAGCLLTIGPMLIIYMFVQKYFVESIDKVGIKS